MAKRPEDPRSFNERIYPIVTLLEQLGHPVKMPDHPMADDAKYEHWLDATTKQLEADTAAAAGDDVSRPTLAEEHHKLQCVVAENLRRLADLTDVPLPDDDDVGQSLDSVVDGFIDLVHRIVERNEELANQLEDCRAGVAAANSMDKAHDPENPAHKQLLDAAARVPTVAKEDRVLPTGKASNRTAQPEDAEPVREEAPQAAQVSPPSPPPSTRPPSQRRTPDATGGGHMGPWY